MKRTTAFVACLALAASPMGCGRRLNPLAIANRPPSITLSATVDSAGGAPLARLTWTATDPDGRVDHFLVAHDPASLEHVDAGWEHTSEHARIVPLRARAAGALRAATHERPYETFAVRAADDRGAMSPPATEAFFGTDIAPTVRILEPLPSHIFEASVGSPLRLQWSGADPDARDGRPWKYKLRIIPYQGNEALVANLVQYPDSIAAVFGPDFRDWQSFEGRDTTTLLDGLQLGQRYLILMTALDREGAYDPFFSLDKNMLRVLVVYPFLSVTIYRDAPPTIYASGGFGLGDAPLHFSMAQQGTLTLRWFAGDGQGVPVTGYRWAVDPLSGTNDVPRRGPSDVQRWSRWSLSDTSATLGPGLPVGEHRLEVQAMDAAGDTALGWVRLTVVTAALDKPLLIVNDTRLETDQLVPGMRDTLRAPAGAWPSAAELDTFLFAVGGVRWRMTPSGTDSPRGTFAGFAFDTLSVNVLHPPTLATLGAYRHIVWLTNTLGLGSALATMNLAEADNPLASYVQSGGELWLCGGAAAGATLARRDQASNDIRGLFTFSSFTVPPELMQGEFIVDDVGWRSEFRTGTRAMATIHRFGPAVTLPPTLDPKSPETDPVYPYRLTPQFYRPIGPDGLEWLSTPDNVADPRNPSTRHQADTPALDTLYVASDGRLLVDRPPSADDAGLAPVMTVDHGAGHGRVIFSGFDIWHFRHDECVQLVDAVLHGMWGMNRSTPSVASASRGAGVTAARRAAQTGQARSGGLR